MRRTAWEDVRDMDASNDEMYGSMYLPSKTERNLSDSLPSCVTLRKYEVTEAQEVRDRQLPRLLSKFDESFTSSHMNRDLQLQLAREILLASSSPIKKYRILDFFGLLERNKSNVNIGVNLNNALTILLKYATNLIKEDKHPSWRKVKYKLPLVQHQVLPIEGALDILVHLGYTRKTDTSISFPDDVLEPDVASVVVLAADLVLATTEWSMLRENQHPFLVFTPISTLQSTHEREKVVDNLLNNTAVEKPKEKIKPVPKPRRRAVGARADMKPDLETGIQPRTRERTRAISSESGDIRRPPPLVPLVPFYATTVNDQGLGEGQKRAIRHDMLEEETISCPNCMLLRSSFEKTCPSCGHVSDRRKPTPKRRSKQFTSHADYVDMTAFTGQSILSLEPRYDQCTTKPEDEQDEGEAYVRMDWKCEYCTYLNPISTHVCGLCSKTPTNLQGHYIAKAAQKLGGDRRTERTLEELSGQSIPSDDMYSKVTKKRVVEDNIYDTPKKSDQPPPLPLKKSSTHSSTHKTASNGDVVRNSKVIEVQRELEREASEKERIKKKYAEKKYLYDTAQITEEEFNDVDFDVERMRNVGTRSEEVKIEELIFEDIAKSRPAEKPEEPGMSDERLLQLLIARPFAERGPSANRTSEPGILDYERIDLHKYTYPFDEIPPHNIITTTHHPPKGETRFDLQPPDDLFESMFNEFCALNMQAGPYDNVSGKPLQDTTYGEFYNYHVTREVPRDPLRDLPSISLKKEPQEAENAGFSPAELNLAKNLSWQDPEGRDPVQWLKQEWNSRIANVLENVEKKTSNENDRIGNISTEEVKAALLDNQGSVESACKTCIESRREKLAKMTDCSTYGREECLMALDVHEGNMKQALFELEAKSLEPLRRRLQSNETDSERDMELLAIVRNPQVSLERRVRVLLAEYKMRSWGRAEIATKLVDRNYGLADCVEAAHARNSFDTALEYLSQECPICMEEKPMGQMITYLNCQDRICKDCIIEHLTLTVQEKNIHQLSCPVCGLPDLISDEGEATTFFNHLDIMCASGFINEIPNALGVTCPNCGKNTCFKCKRQWEPQHEGITCDEFARWKEENDEDFQREGLAGHLARHGIECPNCNFRYDLAKGGCMHFTCNQCKHEFCCGCFNSMKRGALCQVLPSCARKGLHCHHPRNCLFYLRDWEPQRLQQLLNNLNIEYHRTEVVEAVEAAANAEYDQAGAVAAEARATCNVMEQKEGPNGFTDDKCGAPCEEGHENLCKVHYNEYLVDLINKEKIDPAVLMNSEELTVVLERRGVDVLERNRGESEDLYRARLLDEVVQKLPLYNEEKYEEIYDAPDVHYVNAELGNE